MELWTEIHEVNDQGEYAPVEVKTQPDVVSGGVFQLRQVTVNKVLHTLLFTGPQGFVRHPMVSLNMLLLVYDTLNSHPLPHSAQEILKLYYDHQQWVKIVSLTTLHIYINI